VFLCVCAFVCFCVRRRAGRTKSKASSAASEGISGHYIQFVESALRSARGDGVIKRVTARPHARTELLSAWWFQGKHTVVIVWPFLKSYYYSSSSSSSYYYYYSATCFCKNLSKSSPSNKQPLAEYWVGLRSDFRN